MKVGNLNEVSFARKTVELNKIREMKVDEVREGLGVIFVRAINLLGIKEKISQINKEDIRDMILLRFKSFSLEEIDYAFKLDRWSGKPVEHFQLFNSEYVAKVLTKYKHWLRETRSNNNLPLSAKKESKPELSDQEKLITVINGVIDCFEEFKISKSIPVGRIWVYDFLYENKNLPVHTLQFRNKINRNAIKQLHSERNDPDRDGRKIREVLRQIQTGNKKLKIKCKELVLKEYFSRLIAQNKEIAEELN